jgi:hypothetical protein
MVELSFIQDRVARPTAEQVREARRNAGLSQAQAAQAVLRAKSQPYRIWQGYEAPEGSSEHRDIPLAAWELFLLVTAQHPEFMLVARN